MVWHKTRCKPCGQDFPIGLDHYWNGLDRWFRPPQWAMIRAMVNSRQKTSTCVTLRARLLPANPRATWRTAGVGRPGMSDLLVRVVATPGRAGTAGGDLRGKNVCNKRASCWRLRYMHAPARIAAAVFMTLTASLAAGCSSSDGPAASAASHA